MHSSHKTACSIDTKDLFGLTIHGSLPSSLRESSALIESEASTSFVLGS
jgi:hypothetical protein